MAPAVPAESLPAAEQVEGGTAGLARIESAGRERHCVRGIREGRVVFDSVGLKRPGCELRRT